MGDGLLGMVVSGAGASGNGEEVVVVECEKEFCGERFLDGM